MFTSTLPIHLDAIAEGRTISMPCERCNGNGERIYLAIPERDGFSGDVDAPCDECDGEGWERVPVTAFTTGWLFASLDPAMLSTWNVSERELLTSELQRRNSSL